MKRIWVIVSVIVLALVYSNRASQPMPTMTHISNVENITAQEQNQEQNSIIREYLFIHAQGEVQNGQNVFSHPVTRILNTLNLMRTQWLRSANAILAVYDKPLQATVNTYKANPYPKRYFIFFLSSLNC